MTLLKRSLVDEDDELRAFLRDFDRYRDHAGRFLASKRPLAAKGKLLTTLLEVLGIGRPDRLAVGLQGLGNRQQRMVLLRRLGFGQGQRRAARLRAQLLHILLQILLIHYCAHAV